MWWEEGWYAEENDAVKELIATFEAAAAKEVELRLQPASEQSVAAQAAIDAGAPPDFLFGIWVQDRIEQWAFTSRLVDLTDAVQPLLGLFDADALDQSRLLDKSAGRRSLYALPLGRSTLHLHAWESLLERAGFTLADIPDQWEAFWSFWCDRVQPAIREAVGHHDIWAVGLPMSPVAPNDTRFVFMEFVHALGAGYVTADGALVIDRPDVRAGLVAAIEGYTAIWRKGCTPPDAVTWDGRSTVNQTLSIPNALRASRPNDYYQNVATIEWPSHGRTAADDRERRRACRGVQGRPKRRLGQGVRSLSGRRRLARALGDGGPRPFPATDARPPQAAVLARPDRSPPHALSRITPRPSLFGGVGQLAPSQGECRGLWERAIHRVVTDGITPEQAVDQAIARIKVILEE